MNSEQSGITAKNQHFLVHRTQFTHNSSPFTGFTLAETLITIGMIGVIAALTLPTLMNATNEKEIVTKVKKTRANLNEAYRRAVAKYDGQPDTWIRSSERRDDDAVTKRIAERIFEFMQIDKSCGFEKNVCFKEDSVNYDNVYSVILSDGTAVTFYSDIYNEDSITHFVDIYIDIDGPKKGKNELGKDIFCLDLNNNGVVGGCWDFTTIDPKSRICAANWIFTYDNADYLHIDSSGKCPNGTVLSDTNPTCN